MKRRFAAAILLFATWAVAAQNAPCTLKPVHIPISSPGAPDKPYHVNVSFGDSTTIIPLEVDTGSTGIVVAADALPQNTQDATGCRRPVLEYTSDQLYEVGTWKQTTVTFWDAAGKTKLATTVPIDVLAVAVIADVKKGTSHKAGCGNNAEGAVVRCAPSMIGVGFARGTATPDLNPFLQLTAMNGSGATMQRGYVLTTGGITLGITSDDVNGFGFVGLQKNAATGDWSTETGTITTSTFGPVPGPTLVDTGIDGIIIGHNPAPPTITQGVSVSWDLSNGTSFTFVPDPSTPVATAAPPPGQQAFINTGRTLLKQADYLFDADCGRVGFRKH